MSELLTSQCLQKTWSGGIILIELSFQVRTGEDISGCFLCMATHFVSLPTGFILLCQIVCVGSFKSSS